MIISRDWKWFVLGLGALGSVAAQADGSLSLSYRGQQGFSLLQIVEQNGVKQGTVDGMAIGSIRRAKELDTALGNDRGMFDITIDSGGNTVYYNGYFSPEATSHVTYYKDKDGYRLSGDVGGTQYDVQVIKDNFSLYWKDSSQGQEIDYEIDLSRTPTTEPGSCTGKFTATAGIDYEELAQVFCHSDGTMADSIFSNPDDVIAFIVQLQVPPPSQDPNPDPSPSPRSN
jgi:hypothetical protein